MRAVTYQNYGGPEVLRLSDVPDPVLRSGHVVVRVLACGINLSDWENLTGSPAYARIGGLFRPRKSILGSDIVGEVTASEDSDWPTGTRVWAEVVMQGGGFAEFATLPINRLANLPADIPVAQAAALPQPGAIALAGMAGVSAGQRVLINGAGGASGPLAIQLAKAAGAHVTGVDTAAKAGFMRSQGADATIDFAQQGFCATGPYDLILDLVATRRMAQIAPALADDGRYRLIGGQMRAMLSALTSGSVRRLLGSKRMGVTAAEGDPPTLDRIGAAWGAGALIPQIAGTLGLSDVPDALAQVGAGKVAGKLVVLP